MCAPVLRACERCVALLDTHNTPVFVPLRAATVWTGQFVSDLRQRVHTVYQQQCLGVARCSLATYVHAMRDDCQLVTAKRANLYCGCEQVHIVYDIVHDTYDIRSTDTMVSLRWPP
jgi:hypothetical protein